ncbi:hypothetical protein [Micromonospora sp. DT229]|uniref:hypothetical protein n=1 Tax=Micromonospora sp. DT229 TaxID=3393430 RepID=UPI003CE723DD
MAFDRARYERDVVKPLRGRHGPLADDDLLRRYAVDPEMSPQELERHLRDLRTYWNQTAGGPDSKARVCRQFLTADEELRRTVGAKLHDPAWWQVQAQRQDETARQAIKQLVTDLTRAYGSVQQVTRAQLAGIASQYPALRPAQVQQAARQAGLRLVDTVELPTDSGLTRTAFRELGQRLGELGLPTVVHLLHPGIDRPFTLVRDFAVPNGPRLELSPAVLADAMKAAERAADSPALRARKAALRLLDSGLRAGADLRTIALFQIVEQLSTARSGGVADVLLIRTATRLGVTQEDAELLVASLPLTSGTSGGADRIRDLLAAGELRAAEQALAAVPAADPQRAELQQAVGERQAEFERLLRTADTAQRERREEDAERALRDAQRIAADDSDLDVRLSRLPLPPPGEVTVTEYGDGVRLSWQPSNTVRTVRYRVVRGEGRVPELPSDGVEVAGTADTTVVDPSPPVVRDLHYAVFAGTETGAWSRPATVAFRLVPPIGAVTLAARADQVAGSWPGHPDLVEVQVRRTAGRPPQGASDGTAVSAKRTAFVDRDVREGEQYYYQLTAIYHDPQGRKVRSAAKVVAAVPRAEAQPFDGLTVRPLAVRRNVARVQLSWPAAAGQIQVRYASVSPPWEFGTVLPLEEIHRFGREAVGLTEAVGSDLVLETEVPAGPLVYVPFTVGGTGAVVGRPVEMGQVEPVTRLHAQRIGAEVVLSWVWPSEVGLVEVEWERPDAATLVRRLTRSQYVDGSGCVLRVGPAGGKATVRAVSVGASGEGLSAPATVEVAGRAVELAYRLRRPSGLRHRLSRHRLLEVVADQDCVGVDLTVVVSSGLVMPLRVEQGTEVDRFTGLAFARQSPLTFEVEIPRTVRKPYWIRCFADGQVQLTMIDPPVAELKVT